MNKEEFSMIKGKKIGFMMAAVGILCAMPGNVFAADKEAEELKFQCVAISTVKAASDGNVNLKPNMNYEVKQEADGKYELVNVETGEKIQLIFDAKEGSVLSGSDGNISFKIDTEKKAK